MTPTNKDLTGFALVACALALLGARSVAESGGSEEVPGVQTVSLESLATAGTQSREAATVAFVDVTLTRGMEMAADLRRQTVVMRNGVVVDVGPVREVGVPDDALVVDGSGSAFLLPTTVGSESAARIDPRRSVSPGVATDLLLLSADPRGDRHRAKGVLIGSRWYPRTGPVRASSVAVPAGGH